MYREHIYDAKTGETEVIEREYTSEETAEQLTQAKTSQKQAILNELAQLDTVVSREYENTLEFSNKLIAKNVITTKDKIYSNDAQLLAMARKAVLREELKQL